MKSTPGLIELLEASWRRKLTQAEQAELESLLRTHSEAREEWRAEAALNEALNGLPGAPVPSNFTARVLAAAERESRAGEEARGQGWGIFQWRFRWLPRAAAVILVVGLGAMTWQHDLKEKRTARANSLARFSELSAVASPEVLENFDAIQAMAHTPSADEDLIRLLQ